MKNLYSAGLLWLLLFTAFASYSQVEPALNQQIPDKPFLFTSLPNKFECNLEELEKLFSVSPSQKCKMKLNAKFQIEGIMQGKFQRSDRLTSINIRLDKYENAVFNLSRIVEKNTITFTGRIVSINHGDLLLLKQENGKYFFIRQELKFSMVE
jgi:hypothetical protein